jgi:hypothetical protein
MVPKAGGEMPTANIPSEFPLHPTMLIFNNRLTAHDFLSIKNAAKQHAGGAFPAGCV